MKPRRFLLARAARPAAGVLLAALYCGAALAVGAASAPVHPSASAARPVDINNASRAELMTLPGIGAAEAERIERGRPWLSKASLVSGQVLPAATYDGLRGRIFVGAPKRSRGAPAR